MRRKALFVVLFLSFFVVFLNLPSFTYAEGGGFLEDAVAQEEHIKTTSWFERQLAGLIAAVSRQFYQWMDLWGLKDPFLLITADDPNSDARNLGINSDTVQNAKDVVFEKFYRQAGLPISILLIVLAGFQFALATNDEGRNRAKQMILAILTFFAVLAFVDVIFDFLVSIEIASVNLFKETIQSWQGQKFRDLLFGNDPVETMKAIRSIGVAVISFFFVFFMLRMNYVYIARMISLVLLVTILPIVAALSVWPRFRSSLSMLFRELFAQLFMPIGHAAVLLAMYFVVGGNDGNAFYMIPFVFAMGAVERIIRDVFGVDTGIGASLGLGAFSALAGSIAIARGVGTRGSRGRSNSEKPEKIDPRKSDPLPPPRKGHEPKTSGPPPSPSGSSPQTSPRPSGSSGTSSRSGTSSNSSFPQSDPARRTTGGSSTVESGATGGISSKSGASSTTGNISPATTESVSTGTPSGSSSSVSVPTGRSNASGTVSGTRIPSGSSSSVSVPIGGTDVTGSSRGGFSRSISGGSGGHNYTIRPNPYARPVSRNAKIYSTGSSQPLPARKDTVGPMTKFDPKQPIPLEPYTPNMYSKPVSSVQEVGRAIQTGARLAYKATEKGIQVTAPIVRRTAPGLIKGTARLTAGVTAGAAMYTLSGNAEAAGMAAYSAGSAAGKGTEAALKVTGKAGSFAAKGWKRLDAFVERKRIDEETKKRMMASRTATSRFRNTIRPQGGMDVWSRR